MPPGGQTHWRIGGVEHGLSPPMMHSGTAMTSWGKVSAPYAPAGVPTLVRATWIASRPSHARYMFWSEGEYPNHGRSSPAERWPHSLATKLCPWSVETAMAVFPSHRSVWYTFPAESVTMSVSPPEMG